MHCWARYTLWLMIAVLGFGNMLSACGRKGDLYLPEEPAVQQTQQSQEEKPAKPQN